MPWLDFEQPHAVLSEYRLVLTISFIARISFLDRTVALLGLSPYVRQLADIRCWLAKVPMLSVPCTRTTTAISEIRALTALRYVAQTNGSKLGKKRG